MVNTGPILWNSLEHKKSPRHWNPGTDLLWLQVVDREDQNAAVDPASGHTYRSEHEADEKAKEIVKADPSKRAIVYVGCVDHSFGPYVTLFKTYEYHRYGDDYTTFSIQKYNMQFVTRYGHVNPTDISAKTLAKRRQKVLDKRANGGLQYLMSADMAALSKLDLAERLDQWSLQAKQRR